jgi:glyoxylase-like metal-dependent hydrolase (beta-lactamase superfamily II)
VVDTGFDADVARRRQRNILRCPSEGLRALGIDPDKIEGVIITHMHYDHCGNHGLFPRARFHVQDKEM